MEEKTKIILIYDGDNNIKKVIFDIIERYNPVKFVSERTGLSWKKEEVKIKHAEIEKADWEGDDTVVVNFNHGAWCISGIVHELLHLILRQNDWNKDPLISDFIKKHPELENKNRGDGYLIEQMSAYLLQSEAEKEVGKNEDIQGMGEWTPERFERVIRQEYNSDFKGKLAKRIMENWSKLKSSPSIIEWTKDSILKAFLI